MLFGPLAVAQEGALQTIREDVRTGPPPGPARPDAPPEDHEGRSYEEPSRDNRDSDDSGLFLLAGAAVTAPIWVPHQLLSDSFAVPGYFSRFPYDDSPGYMTTAGSPETSRRWAARLDAEYVETFDDLDNIGGHLLVSTTSRFGLDTSLNRLQERLPGDQRDELWIGDCNLVWRFAQSERAEFRTGIGVNWLDDAARTDLGFNFTYGLDLYPHEPWVFSTVIDWGTLGHAGLFRIRTTVGAMVRNVEVYTGYEYSDIGRTQWNGLIGGLRIWF